MRRVNSRCWFQRRSIVPSIRNSASPARPHTRDREIGSSAGRTVGVFSSSPRIWCPRARSLTLTTRSLLKTRVRVNLVNQTRELGFLPKIVTPFGAGEVPRMPARPPARDDRVAKLLNPKKIRTAHHRHFDERLAATVALDPVCARGEISHGYAI
jgi:hypothetical protein